MDDSPLPSDPLGFIRCLVGLESPALQLLAQPPQIVEIVDAAACGEPGQSLLVSCLPGVGAEHAQGSGRGLEGHIRVDHRRPQPFPGGEQLLFEFDDPGSGLLHDSLGVGHSPLRLIEGGFLSVHRGLCLVERVDQLRSVGGVHIEVRGGGLGLLLQLFALGLAILDDPPALVNLLLIALSGHRAGRCGQCDRE